MGHFSKKRIAGFFLTGAAVGAAVALLFAPKSGAQTRKDIRKFSKKAVVQIDDMQTRLREQLSDGYEQMIVLIDNVKEYVEEGKNKLQKIIRTA